MELGVSDQEHRLLLELLAEDHKRLLHQIALPSSAPTSHERAIKNGHYKRILRLKPEHGLH